MLRRCLIDGLWRMFLTSTVIIKVGAYSTGVVGGGGLEKIYVSCLRVMGVSGNLSLKYVNSINWTSMSKEG